MEGDREQRVDESCALPSDSSVAGSVHPLVETLYQELKSIAQQRLRRQARNQTLGPTVLVHEVAFRLTRGVVGEEDREGFLRLASLAMQQIVIDHARQKQAKVRGGGRKRVLFEEDQLPAMVRADAAQLVAIGEAIDEFARQSKEAARAAEFFRLHFFAGLTYEQISTSCNVSLATVRRGCDYARAALRRIMTLRGLDHGLFADRI